MVGLLLFFDELVVFAFDVDALGTLVVFFTVVAAFLTGVLALAVFG